MVEKYFVQSLNEKKKEKKKERANKIEYVYTNYTTKLNIKEERTKGALNI